jgi:hypothetical protein
MTRSGLSSILHPRRGAARRWLAVAAVLVLPVAPACRPADPGPLEVGFATVPIPWRVGAKPGQIGTQNSEDYVQFYGDAIGELLPILLSDEGPEHVLEEMTIWAMMALEDRLNFLAPGRYAFLAEPGRGIERPPDIKAVVVRSGEEKVALVRADLYLMHEQIQIRVAELVEPATGMGRDQLFLAGTHNHSSPHAISASAGAWTFADAFDARQFAYVTRAIADAIIAADASLRPAVVRAHATEYREVQQNIIGPTRRVLEAPDGSEEEVDVGFPRDHFDGQLTLLRFEAPGEIDEAGETTAGEHLGSIFVLGMHPETLPSDHGITSGEWPLHVEDRLNRRHGGFWMWLPGSLGDIEPDAGRNDPDHTFWRRGFEEMARMSDLIAAGVTEAWEAAASAPAEARPVVGQIARSVPGPVDYPFPDSSYLGGARLPMVRLLQDTTTIRLHLVRIGEVLLIGVPAETITDLSLNIKSRVGAGHDSVHQGYVFPGAPEWVRDRIAQNFEIEALPEEMRAGLPVVVNVVNGYIGYVVTRWEYENRDHYRESLTAFGPGTAEHIAGSVVGLAREMHGGEPFDPPGQTWHSLDESGVADIAGLLRAFDEAVAELSRELPASDPARVGTLLALPEDGGSALEPVEVRFAGGTNDLPPPSITVEAAADGGWEAVATGPSEAVWLLFEPPDEWTVRWRDPSAAAGASVRVRAEGRYRGAAPGATEPDPLFDPDGADRSYVFESPAFTLGE